MVRQGYGATRLRRGFFGSLVAAFLCVLCAAGAAFAQESLDDLDRGKGESKTGSAGPTKAVAEVNGYVVNRFQYSHVNPSRVPTSTIDLPSLQEILEGNIQLKISIGSKAFVYTDISMLYQNGWLFFDRDGEGGRTRYPEHDVASLHPFVVPSELYVSISPKPWLNLLFGKKRIIWGPGFAFNPTDLVNPPKDPTDPNFQRAGAWVARVELPFEKFTFSALFSPQVLYQQSGIPYSFMKYPDYPLADGTKPADDSYHYLVAARLYMLLFDSDINLFYFFSNKYNNLLENASRFGGSFSRYFFTDYELHFEALFQIGNGRLYPNHFCAIGTVCNLATALAPTRLTDGNVYPRLLVGGRTMFKDESTLSIEYYYQADGYSDTEFEDVIRLLARAQMFNVAPMGTTVSSMPMGGSSGALPQRFTFDPLRRHYLIVSYSKPKIRDDWAISAVLIAGLRDLSGTFSPSVSWSAREWLTLSLYGFIPIHGIPVGQAVVNDRGYNEYSLTPIDFRVLFEVRAFY